MVAALALGLAFVAVDVVGEGTCPAPADVSRRLTGLLTPSDGAPAATHLARLSRADRGVHVELLNATGATIAARDLGGGDESCDALAQAIAVVIAAWEADVDPRLAARVTLPAAPSRKATTVTTVAAAPPGPAPPGPPARFDMGLGLMAALSGGQVAPGARLGGWVAPGRGHLGLGAAISGVTARSAAIGARSDAARWSRFTLGAGPEARFDVGGTTVGARVQALAALLRVEGVGLTTTASDSSTQFGTAVGLHVGRPWGNATPWIGADLLLWPGRDHLKVTGLADQGQLPRVELQLAAGLSLGRFP